MNETRLTTRNTVGTQVIIPKRHLQIEGLEDLTLEDDLILPRWRLVQYSSTIEGHPGQWNNNLTEEVRNYLDLVVLKISPSRAHFNDERELVCASHNGYQAANGRYCLECPLSLWGEDGEPPPCSRGYTFICLDPKDDSLCLVGALSMAVTPAKRYNSVLAHKKNPPFLFTTRFSGTDTIAPKGKFFLLKLELSGENSPEAIDKYRQEYQALATVRIQEYEEPAYDQEHEEEYEEFVGF